MGDEPEVWVAMPSEMDELFYPELMLTNAAPESWAQILVVGGQAHGEPERPSFLLEFDPVHVLTAYGEIPASLLAEPVYQSVGACMYRVGNSDLVGRNMKLTTASKLEHYIVVGGNGRIEVLSEGEPEVMKFPSYETALSAAKVRS